MYGSVKEQEAFSNLVTYVIPSIQNKYLQIYLLLSWLNITYVMVIIAVIWC